MTGVIVRSSANVQAGAKTRLSAILHGVWILGFVMLFPIRPIRLISNGNIARPFSCLPDSTRSDAASPELAGYRRMPVVIYFGTVLGIVGVDLLTGVLFGLALTIAKLLWKATRLEIRQATEDAPGTHGHLPTRCRDLRTPAATRGLCSMRCHPDMSHSIHMSVTSTTSITRASIC